MELIYAYVHHYKNIQEQEFYFSSSFQVSYIDEKLYISHQILPFHDILFTQNQISSIHLIIGKTGSGKSNLLSLIGLSYEERKADGFANHSQYFLVYHLTDHIYYIESIGFCLNENGQITLSTVSQFTDSFYKSGENNQLLYSNLRHSLPWIVTLSMSDSTDHRQELPLSDAAQNSAIERSSYHLLSDSKYYIWKHLEQYLSYFSKDTDQLSIFTKNLYCRIKLNGTFVNISGFSEDSFYSEFFFAFRNYYAQYLYSLQTKKRNPENPIPLTSDEELDNLYANLLRKKPQLAADSSVMHLETYHKTVQFFRQIPESYYSKSTIRWEIGKIHTPELLDTLDKLMHILRRWIYNCNPYISSCFEITYENLSSGELQFVSLFANIEQLYEFSANTFRPLILLLDEPETYMHPELCRRFMLYLTQVCKKFKKGTKCQFIITSHSPFLLSDLPSECVTRITINEATGKCQVLSNDIKTFGSNIHQLLADGFFLKNTIGALSNQVIREILNDLYSVYEKKINNEPCTADDLERCQRHLDLLPYIGDRLIQKRLQELINFIRNDKW